MALVGHGFGVRKSVQCLKSAHVVAQRVVLFMIIELVRPETSKGLNDLIWLYLSKNKISNLPEGIFQDLARLEGLFISRNKFVNIPERFFEGLNLRYLGLDENGITEIKENLQNPYCVIFELKFLDKF